jgi:hypothetical protein
MNDDGMEPDPARDFGNSIQVPLEWKSTVLYQQPNQCATIHHHYSTYLCGPIFALCAFSPPKATIVHVVTK